MADHMEAMGLPEGGFDIDAYINSEMGEGVIQLMHNLILYQEEDPEVYAYWEDLGIRKELFYEVLSEGGEEEKFAVYTPMDLVLDEGEKYPVVFALHGGGNPIFAVESYGFAQLGAKEGYITVMPETVTAANLSDILDFLEERGCPLDRDRVYSVGLSMGGNWSYLNASTNPEMFAAIVPLGQPVIFSDDASAEQVESLGGVAIYNIVGQYDAFGHYPFTVEGFRTSDQKIAWFNQWLEANDLVYEEPISREVIEELYGNSEDVVKAMTGVDFPVTYTFQADGTDFWTGEYVNRDGVNTLRVSMVKDGIHWVTASYARLAWDFLKEFSRDTETRQLVYTPSEVTALYDYEGKELWTVAAPNFVTYEGRDEGTATRDYLNYGHEDLDIDAYIDSPLGEKEIELFRPYLTYEDPMDEGLLAYWEDLGLRKELHDAEDPARAWASYLPLGAEGDLPVVFVFHGNGNSILVSETYGFAQYGAKAGYLTVIPEASNGDEAVAEFERILKVLTEEGYPVDETRVYVTGFSKGGYSAQNVANAYPNRVAGIALGGNPAATKDGFKSLFTDGQMEALTELTMPVIDYAGYFDFNLYPLNEESKLETAEGKIAGFNLWLKASGAEAEELTMEHSLELSKTSEDVTRRLTGIDFTDTEVRELDGTRYDIGFFSNAEGIPVFEGFLVENQMHWPSPSAPEVCWEFLRRFSRDPESGALRAE